jgi:peptide/nickel transport system substrate-binding protein
MPEPDKAMAEANLGKLNIMMGDLGPERFSEHYVVGNPGSGSYMRIVGGFLISDNDKKEMVPGIASQWGLSDDGLTWTFTIREGVKFHDGSDLTAEDVFWTLQHYWSPGTIDYSNSSTKARTARVMDRIELSGPDEVSVITTEPVTPFAFEHTEAANSHNYIMPKRPELFSREADVAYDQNPIGAGPMMLVKHARASVMGFERFDDFYFHPGNGLPEDKRVNFKSLEMFVVPEEATRVAAIRAGEADIAPASVQAKEQVEAGGGRMVFGLEGSYVLVKLMVCGGPPQHACADKRVRQALDLAIDKELIRDQLMGGPEVFQVKGWSAVTPSTAGYSPELDPWPADPERARQLLADAGYPGGEGFGEWAVWTWPSTAMPRQVEMAQLAADMWRRELGLDVEVRVGDSTGIKKAYQARELRGVALWRDNETRPDASSTMYGNFGDPNSYNRQHDDLDSFTPELAQLVRETIKIVDPDERTQALAALYLRLKDESYQLGIGYANLPWGVGPNVLTWQPYPLSPWPSALHTITLK